MKRIIVSKLLVIMISLVTLVYLTGCETLCSQYEEDPEAFKEKASDIVVNSVAFIGKTLPYVLTALGKDIEPPYDVMVMDSITATDGTAVVKDVWPEWRIYHFDEFDLMVQKGGKDDGVVLGTIPKKGK